MNVSKLPPEVLGNIFRWNVTPWDDFWGWEDRSHGFLLVCHHWFEVASRTPELWSFWGTTPGEWKSRCHCSNTTPLDLVLDVDVDDGSFDTTLRGVLQDRATRDTIRRVHLRARDSELLSSVVTSLSVDCEKFRSNCVMSFIFLNDSDTTVDLSDFFARYCFPKLQHLELTNYTIKRWDHLMSRTGALATLSLDSIFPSPIPTTSQLLSILASNPTLQKISLSVCADPDHNDDRTPFRVPLHHLKALNLSGDVRDVVGVLRQLDHARTVDLHLSLHKCTVGDISQALRPYLHDYVQRRDRSPNGLGFFISQCNMRTIGHNIGDVGNLEPPTPARDRVAWFVSVEIDLGERSPKDLLEKAILELLVHTPREEITYFRASEEPITMKAISTQFPNLGALHFDEIPISALSHLGGDKETFPSLQRVFLDQVLVHNYDWSPLTTSLARRKSSGNQLHALEIFGSPHMCTEVVEDIRSVVQHFRTEGPEQRPPCPFNTCPRL